MDAIESIGEPASSLKVLEGGRGKASTDPLDRFEHGKPIRQHIREFGAVMALALTLIAAFQIHKPGGLSLAFGLVVAGLVTWAVGVTAPNVLKKPWEAWMAFAHVLGFVMTTILLTLTWVVMVIPLAAVLRVFGVKVMDATYKTSVATYWETRDVKLNDFKLLERQY
jgi:hypothetical protein